MKKIRGGFTVIEVSIFLAVTGLLFIGITVGVQNSIFQQKYTDAVQGFANFLRNAYSEVLNVQGLGDLGSGTTELAVYGRMIVFGESNGDQMIRTYSVIGDLDKSSDCQDSLNVFDRLIKCYRATTTIGSGSSESFAGIVGKYEPRWGTKIQKANWVQGENNDYEGVILIVRNPESGKVYTGAYEGGNGGLSTNFSSIDFDEPGIIDGIFNVFRSQDQSSIGVANVDFCVNPNGDEESSRRADVRIKKGAANASGIEVIMDGEGNVCRGE